MLGQPFEKGLCPTLLPNLISGAPGAGWLEEEAYDFSGQIQVAALVESSSSPSSPFPDEVIMTGLWFIKIVNVMAIKDA